MEKILTANGAKKNVLCLLEEIEDGDEVIVTKHGTPKPSS